MEEYQTSEDIKVEVVDCEFVEVDSQNVYQLCTACLCATRTTRTLDDDALKQYYMHILTEMQPEGGVVLQSPRVCWECVSHLKRSVRFREQVQDSYKLLQPMLSMWGKEDLAEFLQTSVCRPERLQTCFSHSINISPQDDAMQVLTVTKYDDNNDDEAALGSWENGFERHSPIFQENDASIVEEPSEAFCDEKYNVCVSEDVVSPPMCNYNIENCKDHDKSKEQLDETNAHLRKEVLNDIKIINTSIHTHVSAMSRNIKTTFICDCCYKKFASKAALERHIATNNIYPHDKTVPSTCEDSAVVLCSDDQCSESPNKLNLLQLLQHNKQAKTAEKHFLINECDESFSVEAHLPRDKKVHSGEKPFQCEMCQKSFANNRHLTKHKKRIHTSEKPFQCEMCHKSFENNCDLTKHKRIHTGEKPFQCEMCHKSFAINGDLTKHKRTHSGEKPFQCEICHKSFAMNNNLTKHKKVHTGEKPFQCEMCHKSFANKSDLTKHTRIHTGEKPFQCEMCHKSFVKSHDLTKHKIIHTGEKPYQCQVCNKSFSLLGYLSKHKRVHTGEKPVQCDVCHKFFSQNQALIQHLKIHTGERPFQCEVCNKSFIQKNGMLSHLRTHTGEKPFQCEVCHKSFMYKCDMTRHTKIHTGELGRTT